MGDLVYTEILKLKRSKMFSLTFIGAMVAPFLVVVSTYIHIHSNEPTEVILFADLFFDTNLYTSVLIGVPLYGVAAAYLFSREYAEDTLKNLLTIPVSRTGILVSKMLLLFMWIIALTIVAWGLTLLLGMLGQFDGLTMSLLLQSFKQFIAAGSFLFVLSSPVMLITLLMKNYVPAIILTIVITLINVMGSNSAHKGLIPWIAAFDIVNGSLLPEYPASYSYVSIAVPAIGCFIAALLYFRKADIH